MTTLMLPPVREELAGGPGGCPLPRAFLASLRTLFGILDEQRRGAVHLSEIESRWGLSGGLGAPQPGQQGCSSALLLPEVLAAWRQVAAPCGGYLSFPRLVAGLRIAFLREEERERRGSDPHQPLHPPREVPHNAPQEEDRDVGVHQSTASPHRETEGKGVTRSRSINESLASDSHWRSRHCQTEPRRHTITNGINYDTLKRMKELEQERDSLLHGLDMVEKARDWYHQRLLESQDRQKNMGAHVSSKDFLEDPYSNYGCLLLARIQEVNTSLNNLFSGPTQADDPSCNPPMNSFHFPRSPGKHFSPQTLGALQEQNHLLMKEVMDKSERIVQLEKEKATLCKQIQEHRIYRPASHKESTFL